VHKSLAHLLHFPGEPELSQFPVAFFFQLLRKRAVFMWRRLLQAECHSCQPNQQCRTTEGNSSHSSHPGEIARSSSFSYPSPDCGGRGHCCLCVGAVIWGWFHCLLFSACMCVCILWCQYSDTRQHELHLSMAIFVLQIKLTIFCRSQRTSDCCPLRTAKNVMVFSKKTWYTRLFLTCLNVI